jgi:hypothetical protein
MSIIIVDKIERKSGIDFHDYIRDGRSSDLDPIKVSAVLKQLVDSHNQIAIELEQVTAQLEKVTNLVIHMRDRSKPGPKPKRRKKQL